MVSTVRRASLIFLRLNGDKKNVAGEIFPRNSVCNLKFDPLIVLSKRCPKVAKSLLKAVQISLLVVNKLCPLLM